MIINGFLTKIVILTVLMTFSTDDLAGCFVLDSDNFLHPPCALLSVTSSSDDGHNRQLSDSYGNAQFTCDAAVFPNQRINFVFGLRRHCRGWSVSARLILVTTTVFIAFR
jgi:hypothetical protein